MLIILILFLFLLLAIAGQCFVIKLMIDKENSKKKQHKKIENI